MLQMLCTFVTALAIRAAYPSRSQVSLCATDDEYSFGAWWERTYGYDAEDSFLKPQNMRVALETSMMKAPTPLILPIASPSVALEDEGVVLLKGALSPKTAAALRAEVLERRVEAYAATDCGANWRPLFGDLHQKQNRQRCDLLLPLVDSRTVQLALHELLIGTSTGTSASADDSTPLSSLLASSLGEDAILYELSSLISEPGCTRQPVHSDNLHQENGCLPLVTCFVALQLVTPSMGGTVFIPGTHTLAAHAQYNSSPEEGDALLQTRPSVEALLGAGDASIYDTRVFHCGGSNEADGGSTRAIFYFSFLHPDAVPAVMIPGTMLPSLTARQVTLRSLRSGLAELRHDSPANFDPFSEADKEVETARGYRARADGGDYEAQTSLSQCYLHGVGVEKDTVEAIRWLRLAAAQGGAVDQAELGHCYSSGEGVECDAGEAIRWYRLAADAGDAGAQHSLGRYYATGRGVPRDLEAALWLHQAAATQGHFGAKAAYDETLRQHAEELGEVAWSAFCIDHNV